MERPNSKRTTKPKPWLTYFIKIPYRVLAHEAYITLRPTAQLVYIDFRRHADRHTEFGLRPIPRSGIPYAYGHCAHLCHRNSFRKAMADLEARGFLYDTGQVDLDGETHYYLPKTEWRNWRAPEKDARRVAQMKARVLRREQLDRTDRCTFYVQPRPEILANPLLKFWSDPDLTCTKKVQPFHSDQNREDPERVRVRAKQGECQPQPHLAPYNPAEGQEDRADFLERLRQKNAARNANEAAAVEHTRAFPRKP